MAEKSLLTLDRLPKINCINFSTCKLRLVTTDTTFLLQIQLWNIHKLYTVNPWVTSHAFYHYQVQLWILKGLINLEPVLVSFRKFLAILSELLAATFFRFQALSFGMIVSSALMIWKGLMVVTGSESPIVVVLSGSMEPAFHRGDLLFLTNYEQEDIRVGEIVVFKVGWPVSVDGAGNAHLNSEEEGSGSPDILSLLVWTRSFWKWGKFAAWSWFLSSNPEGMFSKWSFPNLQNQGERFLMVGWLTECPFSDTIYLRMNFSLNFRFFSRLPPSSRVVHSST